MQITDILVPERILCNVSTTSKKASIEILANLIAGGDPGLTKTEVFNSLLNRERLGSTGLGKGVALPHGRLKHCNKTLGAFIRLEAAVDYDAIDGEPVDLLFALLVPEESTQEHLDLLAILAEKFSDDSILEQLKTVKTADEIFKILTGRI